MYKFSKRSEDNLVGVNPRLVAIARKALEYTKVDFTVVEGLRTLERQKMLVDTGMSKTMNSRHLKGEAIDIYPFYSGKVQVNASADKWNMLNDAMQMAAAELGERITWGGTWKTLVDKPHFQIEL